MHPWGVNKFLGGRVFQMIHCFDTTIRIDAVVAETFRPPWAIILYPTCHFLLTPALVGGFFVGECSLVLSVCYDRYICQRLISFMTSKQAD